MTDIFAPNTAPVDNRAGVAAMSRLADRLIAVTPPSVAASLASPSVPRFSPAVTAALSRSAAMSERAKRRARSPSITRMVVDSFVSACSFIPYALVALGLRLIMARLYFLDGQSKVSGPRVPLSVQDFDISVVLPLQVKTETFSAFLTQYAALPVPPMLAAYVVSYAEFILPIMLVLGFGTRFAALGLLLMTAMIQIYVMPQALWTMHVYWTSILMVLLALGAIRWSPDGAVEIGSTASRAPADTNLVFDRNRLLLRTRVFGRDVLTTLDTGATTTDLNANFAETFPQAVQGAKKGRTDITGVGGTQAFDSLEIPEVTFGIGPAEVLLRPATITLQRIGTIGGECCVGNAGNDLLKRSGFTIDFSAMTLRLNNTKY